MIPRALAPIKASGKMPLARGCGAAGPRKCEVLLRLLQRTLPSSNGLRAGAGKGGCAGITMARLFIGVPICGEVDERESQAMKLPGRAGVYRAFFLGSSTSDRAPRISRLSL
ncbi:hypothetical protein CSOJ01_04989 [Colletotrichum sojae]|uniref:Uncharacterized protein n=1 Tax=Colletotrichum sojae TaxID=2175907 RepID=A0A8H6JHI4_9PEZI|nr:hypothetical protein CSOJ01_04989 [Colletotrichum sojae]